LKPRLFPLLSNSLQSYQNFLSFGRVLVLVQNYFQSIPKSLLPFQPLLYDRKIEFPGVVIEPEKVKMAKEKVNRVTS